MKTYKITKDMKEPIPGYREYVFFNQDENGKTIDKDCFCYCYEKMQEFDRRQREARGLDVAKTADVGC